jgi:predicted PurR-regulated permease PerM
MMTDATRIPFFRSLSGELCGLRAFGVIGMFISPMVLAVLVAVWRESVGADIFSGNAGLPKRKSGALLTDPR